MATIGSLSVKIDAVTEGLEKGIAKAGKSVDNFKDKASALDSKLGLLGPTAIAAGAAMGLYMVKSIANTADALGDLSERTGIAVEDLSRLQYVAQLSGSSAEGMNAAIIKLSQGMAAGNPAFEAMGVAVKNADGSLRSQSDVLKDVADKFATYRDGTAKTALAMQLFGKSGAEMVGVLNQGSAGIKELSDESDRLGNTISTKTAKEAARFNDNLDKMSVAAGGIARTVSGPLIESLADLTGGLFEAYMQGETLFGSFERGFKRMAQAKDINTAKERVNELQIEYDKMMKSMAHLEPWEQASFGAMTLATKLAEAKARYSELTQLSENFRGAGFQDPRVVGKVPDDKGNAPDVAASEAAKKAKAERDKERADELAKIRQNELDKANAFIEGLRLKEEARVQSGKTEQEQEAERYTLEQEKLLEALELGLITKSDYQTLELEALMRHREAMADIDDAYLKGRMEAERKATEERKRQMSNLEKFQAMTSQEQALTVFNGVKDQLTSVTAGNKKMFEVQKALNITDAIMSTYAGAARALRDYPFPYSAAIAGAVVAAGLSRVSAIRSQSFGGGGGGGGGGGRGAMPPMPSNGMANQGGASSGMTAAPAQAQTITIQMQGEIFGREQVRALITEINDAVADGAVLRLA